MGKPSFTTKLDQDTLQIRIKSRMKFEDWLQSIAISSIVLILCMALIIMEFGLVERPLPESISNIIGFNILRFLTIIIIFILTKYLYQHIYYLRKGYEYLEIDKSNQTLTHYKKGLKVFQKVSYRLDEILYLSVRIREYPIIPFDVIEGTRPSYYIPTEFEKILGSPQRPYNEIYPTCAIIMTYKGTRHYPTGERYIGTQLKGKEAIRLGKIVKDFLKS